MVDAAPFSAVRYDPKVAGDAAATSAPSYDDVEPALYARHRTASPYTVLELLATRSDAAGYAAATAALARWRRTGVLVTDPAPAFYLYEEHELRHGVPAVQRGILAAVALEELGPRSSVLPHEAVDPERVADRLERLAAVPVDVAPVFGLYRGRDAELAELLARRPATRPIVAASDRAGTDHRVWAIDDPARITAIRRALADVPVVIADGHHRYAAALAFAQRQQRRLGADPAAPWMRTLMYLVDISAAGPRVEPVHRLLEGVATDAPERLAAQWHTTAAPASPIALARRLAEHPDEGIGLLVHGRRPVLLRPRADADLRDRLPSGRSQRWRALPSALCDHVLVPALDPAATTHRLDVAAAAEEVRGTERSALLILPPVAATTVLDLAVAGEPMPPKSTSFHPKPRTGLILRDVVAPDAAAAAPRRLEGEAGTAP